MGAATAATSPAGSRNRPITLPDSSSGALAGLGGVVMASQLNAQPLTIPMLAELVGVGVRHLQKGFEKHLGTTPLQYLREIRLEGAREDLLTGSADETTVNAVAYRWGFAHVPRFAGYYRRRYRELPSETLARAPTS